MPDPDFVQGNPPFVGYTYQNQSQKEDLSFVIFKTGKKVDYVVGWYYRAAMFMQNSVIRAAFVSTNSITQGEQAANIFGSLYREYCFNIIFAHRTFQWDSEANLKAHVHCVIIGFCVAQYTGNRYLYNSDRIQAVSNINAYLLEAPNVFICSRNKPLCDVPDMSKGSQPTDGGKKSDTIRRRKGFFA